MEILDRVHRFGRPVLTDLKVLIYEISWMLCQRCKLHNLQHYCHEFQRNVYCQEFLRIKVHHKIMKRGLKDQLQVVKSMQTLFSYLWSCSTNLDTKKTHQVLSVTVVLCRYCSNITLWLNSVIIMYEYPAVSKPLFLDCSAINVLLFDLRVKMKCKMGNISNIQISCRP